MAEKAKVPRHMTAYDRVLRAAAVGPVYVSRSTSLDGERKTVSWHLAKKMEMNGSVKRANTSPDWIFLTGGRHYLENVYREHLTSGGKDENSPDFKADQFVLMLKKLGLRSAIFIPENQTVGLSLHDWYRLPGVPEKPKPPRSRKK
jgi:hypothetical protein